METTVRFTEDHIAACGINCGTCRAFLRERNKCSGCRISSGPNIPHCSNCKIRNCEQLKETESKFCYECTGFPCKKIRNLEKRYKLKYRTSLIQNLVTLSQTGMPSYLLLEKSKWTCRYCGAVLSVHETHCLKCKKEY